METFILNPTVEKKCPHCHLVKSIDCFYNDRKSKDGHTYYCKNCIDEASKKRKERLHPKKKLTDYKFCASCGENKQIKDFIYLKKHTGRYGGSKICHSCYNLKRHPVRILPEYKTCTSCGEIKPFKEFLYFKNSTGTRGGHKQCNSCYHLLQAKHSMENAALQKYQKYYNRHRSQLKHLQDKLKNINNWFSESHGYNRKLIYKQKRRAESRLDKLSELIKNDLSNIYRIQKENITKTR